MVLNAPRSHIANRKSAAPMGFTLIEVLAVVTIIAIAGAIVVPAMLKGGTLSAQAASRAVIADVLWAQNEAIAQQKNRSVVFDPTNNAYWLNDEQGNLLHASWIGASSSTAGNYKISFASDSRFKSVTLAAADFGGSKTLTFDPLGSPASGGSADLSANGVTFRVSVASITGRVTVAPVP